MTCRVIELGSPEHAAALRLRDSVLRAPLGLTWSPEDLADEPRCLHLAGFVGEDLIAVLLLKPVDAETMRMRQVAVDPPHQGQGRGAALLAFAEETAKARGCRRLIAHARATALPFYRQRGYVESGEMFLECKIPHRLVSKTL